MIGVGVTAHNRQRLLDDTLAAIKTYTPPDTPVVVVDDGSTPPLLAPDWVQLIRHDTAQGIPAAKNACISALMDAGAEHLFLLDEDTRPCAADWWAPYTDSSEPHLQYSWLRFIDGKRVPLMSDMYRDPNLVGYTWSMGALLYVERRVIDRVGGMDERFGLGFEEHAEWSQRIHNCGFTSFVHQDVPAMKDRVWAADEHYAAPRSFARDPDRAGRLARNQKLRAQLADSTDFVPYRHTGHNVVLTSYFTGNRDLQRGTQLPADTSLLEQLMASVDNVVVLHDSLDLGEPHQKVPAPLPAYTQRWLTQYQYLRDHPDIGFVWCVDATDVTALRDPFTHMTPNVLYVGDEPGTLNNPWIRSHCPQADRPWLQAHQNEPLLNCGVVGGDRHTVMRLCQTMTDLWAASDRTDPLYEMLFFNQAVTQFTVVHGRQVTTPFKSFLTEHPTAIWAHK